MNSDEIKIAAESLQENVLTPLKERFVGKDDIVDLLGICVAARENLFLHGPPGTAKSALVHAFSSRVKGKTFDYLLSRFTEPNELFGPFDIRKLRDGDLITNTEGMLPEADIVFLDELLNANSAILNSLLMALNERVFRRGKETRHIPALFFVGASNHLPEDDTLRALFDRFLLRIRCEAVPAALLPKVLEAGWEIEIGKKGEEGLLTADDLREMQSALASVDLSQVREAYLDLVIKLRTGGIEVSDRRAVRLQRIVAASALVSGRLAARKSDLWIFRHIWDREEQIEIIEAMVAASIREEEPDSDDHPQAFADPPPDPESIHEGLLLVSRKLESDTKDPSAADDLRALSDRIEWIPDGPAKQTLEVKRDELWTIISG